METTVPASKAPNAAGDTDAYGYTTDQDISIEFKKKECCTVDDDGDVVCTGSEVPCELADRTKHGPRVEREGACRGYSR